MPNDPNDFSNNLSTTNPSSNNPDFDPWDETSITIQDIVLSNSWAVQAILNYLEECDPHARDRIWHHYQVMKEQQDQARKKRQGQDDSQSDSIEKND